MRPFLKATHSTASLVLANSRQRQHAVLTAVRDQNSHFHTSLYDYEATQIPSGMLVDSLNRAKSPTRILPTCVPGNNIQPLWLRRGGRQRPIGRAYGVGSYSGGMYLFILTYICCKLPT